MVKAVHISVLVLALVNAVLGGGYGAFHSRFGGHGAFLAHPTFAVRAPAVGFGHFGLGHAFGRFRPFGTLVNPFFYNRFGAFGGFGRLGGFGAFGGRGFGGFGGNAGFIGRPGFFGGDFDDFFDDRYDYDDIYGDDFYDFD